MFKARFIAFIAAFVCLTFCFAPDAHAKKHARVHKGGRIKISRSTGVNDARYADIIMNPVTGEIYHQSDPDGVRYPASLTKMMTLYLLFEALEQHKTSLDSRLDISEYATTMPQTNLALTAGDSISVETAIKALVVRSANDVAVVVGEALGGDVDHFAAMMTTKARQLGMKNTVFRNPNGLPNTGQHTTARDMAKLGIALKRDFPKYYPYFSTLQFSHNGVTYYTHNRVMLRYAGVDGIKTGYIGLSGFNLVTSVVRGGRPLVGAVMGGVTGGWRDNRMIELLDDSYQIVAARGAARGKLYPANLPLPKNGRGKGMGVDAASIRTEDAPVATATASIPDANEDEDGGEQTMPSATIPSEREAVRQSAPPVAETPFNAAEQAASADATATVSATVSQPVEPGKPPPAEAPVVIAAPMPHAAPSRSKVIQLAARPSAPAVQQSAGASPFAMAAPPTVSTPKTTLAQAPVAQPAASLAPVTAPSHGDWGIQVGAFSTQALAVQAARTALQVAAKPLAAATMAQADPAGSSATVHRARLEGLTQLDARKACELMIASNSPCFIYKVSQ